MGELDLPIYAGIATLVFCILCLGVSLSAPLKDSSASDRVISLFDVSTSVCWASYFTITSRQTRRELSDLEAMTRPAELDDADPELSAQQHGKFRYSQLED